MFFLQGQPPFSTSTSPLTVSWVKPMSALHVSVQLPNSFESSFFINLFCFSIHNCLHLLDSFILTNIDLQTQNLVMPFPLSGVIRYAARVGTQMVFCANSTEE